MTKERHQNAQQLHAQGDLARAAAAYEAILRDNPEDSVALCSMGDIAKRLGKIDIAEQLVKKSIFLDPGYNQAHINLASIFKGKNQNEAAIAHYLQALKIGPEFGEIHNNLGNLFRATGDNNNAIKHFNRALQLKPETATIYRHLTEIETVTLSDQQRQFVEQKLATANEEDRIHYSFALANHLHCNDHFSEAFDYYRDANDIMCKKFKDFRKEWHDYVDAFISSFDRAAAQKSQDIGCPNPGAVFVVGLPRSGKTSVERLLSTHEDIFAAGELPDFERIVKKFTEITQSPSSFHADCEGKLQEIGADYLRSLAAKSGGNQWVVNTMPSNYLYIGAIKSVLPNARIIHCYRDPMDNCMAIYQKYFADRRHWYAYDLSYLEQYIRDYQRLMDHWETVHPGSICHVSIEELIDNPLQTRYKMFKHIGVKRKLERGNLDSINQQILKELFPGSGTADTRAGKIGIGKQYAQYLQHLEFAN